MLPCADQSRGWNAENVRIYEEIKAQADKVVYLSSHYFRGCMHQRNRHLVDHSGCCICYLTGDSGGTAYTVSYARAQGLPIMNIATDEGGAILMQNIAKLSKPLHGLLDQIVADLEVKGSEELATMKAEGDRRIAEAIANKTPVAIIHRRIGNRERLEAFLHLAHSIREIPAVHRNMMQTKITEDFVGELELRIFDDSPGEAESAFCDAVSAVAPFFGDISTVVEDGCTIIRAMAVLFAVVAFTEPFSAQT